MFRHTESTGATVRKQEFQSQQTSEWLYSIDQKNCKKSDRIPMDKKSVECLCVC